MRQNSDVSVTAENSFADGTTMRNASCRVKSRPHSALQENTRPLSAMKKPRRPVSAPRALFGVDAAYDEKLARFQDAWVDRREASAQRRKKRPDPFKDFLEDDPRIAQLVVERTLEDRHIRSCKHELHHKAILGKLDAKDSTNDGYLHFPEVHPHSKVVECPATGLHKLQQDMMQSHKDLCQSNPEAMGSFIDHVKERKRQQKKDHQENKKRDNFKKIKSQSSTNLKDFKKMLNAVQHPKKLELWNTAGVDHFRNRYRKHHDQCMLETDAVAEAVRMYQDKNGSVHEL